MGFWDSLLGRRRPTSPDDIRQVLFEAAARDDGATLAKLAALHEATVLEHFGEWQKVPDEVRRDPAAVQAYATGLIGVAQHFAAVRGRPELLERLTGGDSDNPLVRWQRTLEKADARMEEGDYTGAAELLRSTLETTSELTGSAVDEYLPKTLGRLSTCLFHTGDDEGAVAPFERALALCKEQDDDEGVAAYLDCLYEVHRYRGDAEAAARCLDRRADLHERAGERGRAAKDRAQAAIVRAGEPLCRVLVEVGGEIVEVTDVTRIEGRVRFIFTRNRIALRPCTVAVEAGVARGEAGDFEGALAALRRAAAADRFDPWPSYHAGITLLHLRRYREAVESFRTTEDLAPGWYHCRADLWVAEQLVAGTIDHAMFERLCDLVDGSPPPERALAEARRGIQRRDLGLLRLMAGDALGRLGRGAEAEAEYRSGLAIAEEPDVKTRLLVALGVRLEGGERQRLLGEACELRGNLVAAATATVILRAEAS